MARLPFLFDVFYRWSQGFCYKKDCCSSIYALISSCFFTVLTIFDSNMTTFQLILGGIMILVCALFAFAFSILLTVGIFKKKEY